MISFVNLKSQWEAYRQEFLEAEERVHTSGHYIGGEEVNAFERELEAFSHVSHAVTCASGTDALELSLMALGLSAGDEVIVPDFTFISPAECVVRLGGVPKFAEITPEDFLLSPESLSKYLSKKTVGIIAVHLFGQIAPMSALEEFAKKNGLWLLGDSAQAFGATQNGVHSVSLGDISITSFYPTKPLGSYGDGGAIFTHNEKLADKVRMLANHGAKGRYFHEAIGKNSRLDALQAAYLRIKLKHFEEEIKVRKENAEKYDAFFSEFEDIVTPKIAPGNSSTYAQYTLRSKNRNNWLSIFDRAEIPTEIYYPRTLSRQPCFLQSENSNREESSKNVQATRACHEAFSLPICAFTPVDTLLEKLKQAL